jgi:hypothetical protein
VNGFIWFRIGTNGGLLFNAITYFRFHETRVYMFVHQLNEFQFIGKGSDPSCWLVDLFL